MNVLFGLAVGLLATQLGAQTASDETAIRTIVQDESAAWNQGDAVAYSRHFAADGTFTNIAGQFFTGYDAFLKQHQVIFEGRFKQTRLQQDIVSLTFVRPDVAVVDVLTSVAGVVATQLAPGASELERDLIAALSKRDLLVRSHGGAIKKAELSVDFPLEVKASQHHDEKVRIGSAAAALVRRGFARGRRVDR